MGHERIGEVFNFGVLHMEWPTALYIFVVFVITMLCLNFLLFRPILRTLEARKEYVKKNKESVTRLTANIKIAKENYQSKLLQVQKEITAFHKQAVDEAKQQSNSIISAAKKDAEIKLQQALEELDLEKDKALAQARGLTQALAQSIEHKTLG